ncbi:dihydrofolate reductase [bacterium]|nr:MAG: dihydrofolate reductase [bacterium]
MNQRQVVVFIAMSVDGYIADRNDDIGFLSRVETPGEDYGYQDFVRTIDTVIMGRKTYDKVLSLGIEFPHRDKKCYVLSRSRKGKDRNVEFYNGDIGELIAALRRKKGLDIFIDGGSEPVFQLMEHELIDKYIISVIPALVGGGIPLFKPDRPAGNLKLLRSIAYPSGLVQLWYAKEQVPATSARRSEVRPRS